MPLNSHAQRDVFLPDLERRGRRTLGMEKNRAGRDAASKQNGKTA